MVAGTAVAGVSKVVIYVLMSRPYERNGASGVFLKTNVIELKSRPFILGIYKLVIVTYLFISSLKLV